MTNVELCFSKLFVAILCLLSLGCGVRETGPRIAFDSTEFSGNPAEGRVRHRFVFRNSGNRVLEILNTESGCGCLGVQVGKKELEPGDASWIDAEMAESNERREVLITVKSNDIQRPVLRLKVISTGPRFDTLEFLPNIVKGKSSAEAKAPVNCLLRLIRWKENGLITDRQLKTLTFTSPSLEGRTLRYREIEPHASIIKFGLTGTSSRSLLTAPNWLVEKSLTDREVWILPLEIDVDEDAYEKSSEMVVEATMEIDRDPIIALLRIVP